MVSWTNLFPADPIGGTFDGVVRYPMEPPFSDRAWLTIEVGGYRFASPGTVDVNAITRWQYPPLPDAYVPVPGGWGAFNFVADDFAANPGKTLTGSVFMAPASAFGAGVVPTPSQIYAQAIYVLRLASGRTTPGALKTFLAYNEATTPGPPWTPNTKYWVLMTPTAVTSMASLPSPANDVPLLGADVNVIGRAISVWTARTPTAPIITSPTGATTAFAGNSIDLTFVPTGPDVVQTFPGDGGPNDFYDLAGVEIQYRPEPTVAEPDPEWEEFPIANEAGTAFGPGWYMHKSASIPAGAGSKVVWANRKLTIRCGSVDPLSPNSAYLPAGEWQVRLRTFSFGHPYVNTSGAKPVPFNSGDFPPLGDPTYSYNPDNYPEVNTSPWSAVVTIGVSAQVPKPLALSPTNSVAKVVGTPVSLVWQYRNTYSPPFPQEHRVVQIRQFGESAWTTLVDEDSSSSSLVVSGYDMVSGNAYQWRVQVTDSSGIDSAFSDPAMFWIVPVPNSGEVIPDPGTMIDGATLGCGRHRVEVYRRGGKIKVGELTGVSYVKWSRVRDDISKAKVIIDKWDESYGEMLENLKTWAHEVRIYRDNGFSNARVWEGPITLLTYKTGEVVIDARDVGVYPYRRIIKQIMNDFGTSVTAGDKVTRRAARVLQNVMAPDDPNVLAYLTVVENDDDAKQYRSLPAYSKTAFEEVDDMAANAGLDYTVVGRRIILWSTKHRIGTLPEFRDKDLGNSPIVSEYGMSAANVYAVSDGNGTYGQADRLNDAGEDPIYGLIEVLSSTWASDSEDDTGTYTQDGLATIRESFADAAERSLASKYPPPVVVRVPDNTRLNPDTVIDIQHLVPGVVIPLRSTATLRHVVASQKLDSVTVVEQKGEETITVTMSPFSRDDRAPDESGEE